MKRFILILMLLTMTACQETGGGAETAKTPTDNLVPDDPGNQDPGGGGGTPNPPQTIPLTIFTLTRTIAPSGSYPAVTFTATAGCAEYGGKQFCWDDGLHQSLGGPVTFNDNYFGLQVNPATGNPQSCKISCNSSYMSSVRDVTSYRNLGLIVLGGTLGQEIDHILANGTPTQTSCTLSGTTLTCGNLVLEGVQ